ncbi:unnamed protein product [marine sediment metagenome]|uniref:Uncharacterized protein n=1 Tax=marine sediment metagenome TaxID=412755 RepID=X1DPL5_9ZZZZ
MEDLERELIEKGYFKLSAGQSNGRQTLQSTEKWSLLIHNLAQHNMKRVDEDNVSFSIITPEQIRMAIMEL